MNEAMCLPIASNGFRIDDSGPEWGWMGGHLQPLGNLGGVFRSSQVTLVVSSVMSPESLVLLAIGL